MPRGFVIALLGAESTGKTTLAPQLAQALVAPGVRSTWIAEVLREWCVHKGRAPLPHEHAAIAEEQTRRIAAAAAAHDVVVADTTALMVAAYLACTFGDDSLLAPAGALQGHVDLTLLTALDLPWTDDGLQREGPQVQRAVDAAVRGELLRQGLGFSVVAGAGPQRLQAALAAVAAARRPEGSSGAARWQHLCAHCGDPDCERRLRVRLASGASGPGPGPWT